MSFWDKNLLAIKKMQPYFANHLEEVKKNGEDIIALGERINVSEAKDGNPVLTIMHNGKEYFMNSKFRPVSEAEKYAAQFDEIKDYSVSLFFGYGNGTIAREIIKKGNSTVRYCFYEPCKESFLYCMHNYDMSDILSDDRVTIYVEGLNKDETAAYLPNYIQWANIPLTEIYVFPKYTDIFYSEYRDFVRIVRDIIVRAQMAQNTMVAYGSTMMKNSIMHLQFLYNSVNSNSFVNYFPKDLPAILVSAGPSLAKNIHLLKECKGKALIMCVDSAYRKLVREGISPDIMVSIDPNKGWLVDDVEDFKDISGDVAYLSNTIGAVWLMRKMNFYRNIFFNGDDQYIESLYKDMTGETLQTYATGGSVACSAYSILESWGFETIILIGQDLAFTGGKRYSLNLVEASMDRMEKVSKEKGFTLFDVPGYYGDTVTTREDYYTYLKWFESSSYVSDVKNLINATEGGAMINGFTNMSLKDALDKYAVNEYDIKELIENAPLAFPENAYDKLDEIIKNFPNRARYFMRNFKEGIALAERGMTLANRANCDPGEFNKITKSLDKIDKAVSNEPEFIIIGNRAIDVQNRVARERMVSGEEANAKDEQKQVFASLILLYRAYYDAAVEMKEYAEFLNKKFDEEGRK
ncbi:MAG: DUF115 domain-containing protein [Lachnospiraceae bacterium]|nr:DUF115 domain-containing protein [Lachnospiraceae bacterium]